MNRAVPAPAAAGSEQALPAPVGRPPLKRRAGDIVLQLRRSALLFSTILRYGAGPLGRKLLRLPPRGLSYPVRIRLALERLGLTYLKLGQYLATRFDILPPEVCRELGKLFENVPPMSFERARAVIEQELGTPLTEVFASFEPEPIAAASVAQVHEARTRQGERVAVKVQRPGIERIFRADITISFRLTRLVDAAHLLGRLSATEMLGEFATWTLQETNFLLEGRTAERVRRNAVPYEVIPKVYWTLTTPRVLTLEFIEATSLARIDRLVEQGAVEELREIHPGLDLDLVLHHLTFASLHQIFDTGLFHGDPHPGNILVLPDNRVAFVDFGIFGELTRHDREILGGQIENLALGNIDESLRFYVKQLTVTEESDPRAFRQEARQVLAEWFAVSLQPGAAVAQRHVGKYMFEMINISRRHRLLYDMSYLLYWRALNALDSTALRLSDRFDLIDELRAFFEQLRPDVVEQALAIATNRGRWRTVAELLDQGPVEVDRIVDQVAGGRSDTSPLLLETNRGRRSLDTEVRRALAGLWATSVLVIATHARVAPPGRVLGAGVSALLMFLSVARTKRR